MSVWPFFFAAICVVDMTLRVPGNYPRDSFFRMLLVFGAQAEKLNEGVFYKIGLLRKKYFFRVCKKLPAANSKYKGDNRKYV